MDSSVFKFAVVGAWGFVVNAVVLIVGVRFGLKPSVAGAVGAELAIVSNFILNNIWTFSDRQIAATAIVPKFIQFNIFSFGSVLIQFSFLRIGEWIFGIERFKRPFVDLPFFKKLPVLPRIANWPIFESLAKKFSAYFIVYMFAVGVGMVVNYVIYSQIIWR